MVAFYMKEVKKEGSDQEEEDRNYAIEFLHKSLQEYLVARNIWETAKDKFLEKSNRSNKHVINSWQDALEVIRELFAQKELSSEVQVYLVEMIKQDSDEEKNKLQERLLEFFNEMVKRDFGEFSKIRSEDSLPINESLNSFYGCWLLISHIGLDKEKWKEIHLDRFIYLLQSPPPVQSRYLWLFEKANLQGAILQRVNLNGANLQGANLKKVNLYQALLHHVNLRRANLNEAILLRTNFSFARLQGANLQKTILEGANLNEANLTGANLTGANLTGARLYDANFEGAFLERAFLEHANCEEANFKRANLKKASLRHAYLRGANLEGANLEGANLWQANLYRAILYRAILRGANLEGANLEGANLEGAIVDKINWLEDLNLAKNSQKEILSKYEVISETLENGESRFIISKRE